MDELEAGVRKRLFRLKDLADDMAGVRGRWTSEDGAVTVEVDGNGALVDLVLAPSISALTPADFEQRVVATANAAARAAFERRAKLVNAFNAEVAE
ncbi:YbaB/EbfC family nucleoid-associated protein [Nocardia sp. NPDC050697]|uniref:YbaB/EbfC family nucleoid-associated protein n=1 Tax=Nocardia sp. NPDC050697 TaxID=3155158 RepID=UPI0033D9400B